MAAAMTGVAIVTPQVNAVTERPQARLNSLNRPFADRDFITESSIPCCRYMPGSLMLHPVDVV
jgi:hypothetical protein